MAKYFNWEDAEGSFLYDAHNTIVLMALDQILFTETKSSVVSNYLHKGFMLKALMKPLTFFLCDG